jgi:spermidine/putrescine transport system substrate-binding protein
MKISRLILVLIALITVTFFSCGQSKPTLHLYSWADYVKPQIVERFEREFNCRVIIDTFDANESMYAKLKAGASGYDLIMPSGYFLELMEKQDFLQPINLALIPNAKYIDVNNAVFKNKPNFDFSIPYMVGYTVLGYRKDKIKVVQDHWSMFSREDLHGRMTMLNDIREAIGTALKHLGYSTNSVNEDEINEAADQVIEWKRNLAKFESEQYKNGIASSEYLLVQGYSGDIIQVMDENKKVGMIFPEEGTMMYCDYLVIPKTSEQVDLAHAFINFMHDPQNAVENMLAICYVCPNTGAYALLSDDIKNNPGYFPPTAILKHSEAAIDLGESIQLYNTAWDRIKGAN